MFYWFRICEAMAQIDFIVKQTKYHARKDLVLKWITLAEGMICVCNYISVERMKLQLKARFVL